MKKTAVFLFLFLSACLGDKSSLPTVIESQLQASEVAEKYGDTLNLGQAVSIAAERNLDLQITHLKQEIAQIEKQIAVGSLLPQVNIIAGYERNYQDLHLGLPTKGILPYNLSVPVLDEDFYAYAVSAQIPVFVPSLWFLVSARQKGEDIQNLVTKLSEKLITLKVMSEYFYLSALQGEEKARENEKLSAAEFYKQAEISYRTESILLWELQQAEAYKLSAELLYSQNRRSQEIAYKQLLQTLNFPYDSKIRFEPADFETKKIPDLETCILQALEQNEKWKIADLSVGVRSDAKKIAISNFLPKIVLGGTWLGFDNNWITEDSGGFVSVLGLLSVFNGFKNINEYRKALRQEKISEIQLVQEYWTLLREVHAAYNNVLSGSEQFRLALVNKEAMQGKLKQKQAEKKYDVIDLKEYYDVLKEYYGAVNFYEKAYFQYRLALGTLAIAMGKNPYDLE